MIRDINEPITDMVALQDYIMELLEKNNFAYNTIWITPMADPETVNIGLLFIAEVATGNFKRMYCQIIKAILNQGFPESRVMTSQAETCELIDDTTRITCITKFRICEIKEVKAVWRGTKRVCASHKCGKEFEPRYKDQKYCYQSCYYDSVRSMKRYKRICKNTFCKKPFETKYETLMYCNMKCKETASFSGLSSVSSGE